MKLLKTIFSILLFAIICQLGFGQNQTLFIDKDFETVTKQAKEQKKPVVLMFYASWCIHCNKMKNDIFINQDVISFYSQNYICIASNIESKEGIALREKLKKKIIVKSFPTFCFFDENGNITNCISGEFKVEDFIKEGRENLNSENHFASIKSNFENDYSNYYKCFAYILITKRLGLNPTPIAQKHLQTVAPETYYTEPNWKLIANGITDFDAIEFIDLVKNKVNFEKVVSSKRVEKKINFVINENFDDLIIKNDTVNYNKFRKIASNLKIRSIDSLLFYKDLSLYERNTDWKSYHTVLEKSINEFGLKDAQFINTVCANYFVYVDDKKMLKTAVEWEKIALKLNPSLDKYVMISNLLIKYQDFKQALEFANKGKEFGESLGFNTMEIDNILTKIKSELKK